MRLIKLLKKRVRLANWHLSMLKICCTCFGILIGIYFSEYLQDFVLPLFVVGVVTSIWITVVWFKAMCKDSCESKAESKTGET